MSLRICADSPEPYLLTYAKYHSFVCSPIFYVLTAVNYILQLPPGGDLWSCFVDFETKRMDMWEKIVPAFRYNKEIPFFEMLVPTVDTVRFGYLLEKLLAVQYPVLYTGGTGVGKVRITFYNQATTKLAFHSNETSKDKLSII